MSTPSYLWRNKYGTYYFRVRIPLQLCQHFKSSEFKKSLKTDSLRHAVKLARAYRVKFESAVDNLMSKSSDSSERTNRIVDDLLADKTQRQTDAEEKFFAGMFAEKANKDPSKIQFITFADVFGKPVTIDTGNDEQDAKLYNLIKPTPNDLELTRQKERAEELHQAQLAAIVAVPIQSLTLEPELSPPLSEIIQKYLDEGKALNRGEDRSKDQIEATLNLFKSIVGDIPIKRIDKVVARDFKQQYMKLPSNMNKKAAYRKDYR